MRPTQHLRSTGGPRAAFGLEWGLKSADGGEIGSGLSRLCPNFGPKSTQENLGSAQELCSSENCFPFREGVDLWFALLLSSKETNTYVERNRKSGFLIHYGGRSCAPEVLFVRYCFSLSCPL